MRAMALLWVFVCALVGCAQRPGSSYDVFVDTSAGELLADDVLMARDMWVAAVPVRLWVSVADRCTAGDGRICVHTITAAELRARKYQMTDAVADTHRALGPFGHEDGADIYVDVVSTPPDWLHVIVAHELGHAMALEHTGMDTLMCPWIQCISDHVTRTDLLQWESLRH